MEARTELPKHNGSISAQDGECDNGIFELMTEIGVSVYLNFTSDEHLNEYIGKGDERIRFLTGFSGSNGIAVTCKSSVLYTDSRYYIQAMNEMKAYKLKRMGEDERIEEYIESMCENKRVGVCAKLISSKMYDDLEKKLTKKGVKLMNVDVDLVDCLWNNRPSRIFNEVYSIEDKMICEYQMQLVKMCNNEDYKRKLEHEISEKSTSVVGMTYKLKLQKIQDIIGGKTLVITDLDTIAWVFNLRGSDIMYNPVFYSYCLISADIVKLFVNWKLDIDDVEVHPYDRFEEHARRVDGEVLVSGRCNVYVRSMFENVEYTGSIRQLQSIKTDVEIAGFYLAYTYDGIALTRLFEWIDENLDEGITEEKVADKLDEIKKEFGGYVQPSFGTIVGGGPNGAIVHHKAGSKVLHRSELILIDSGSQYVFGTTDTTRTMHFGVPNSEQKRNYTLVLKGQLRAMQMRFKASMPASSLDTLSRMDLMKEGLDYGHATGHGVGHFLCVHESPPSISSNSNETLIPGMVFSIEPGYYKEGEYGIRIENLVSITGADSGFNDVTNLTLVPYQLKMIDMCLINDEEIEHLNKINLRIRESLEPFMIGLPGHKFLIENTMPIQK
ncbi:X-prolyl aminopeptidase [Ordospora colligata]|uniref:X-prolyl aminopeptidase n=1 Tax=Ordospora colligata OC4 TaxID=1354746 RepID=A0A0B2UKL6_9MICR|nr:X-prolyl aminopeptidase [Ordospora colligata OC4]KHN69908.1 X-prolyl aminopeptidase [Ordospora colligata OC4]TBU16078.1 X-prolyl aminopeptidase [Ordospora colligata]TBU16291.1 X-prolyl aminopeptidase [Ordospora colligata]TBU18995.1 X-prolyl aminopeptidase [Ordospora colligata]